jgi:hypothetical protein
MHAAFSKADDLPLMKPKHGVDAGLPEHCHMGKRAEPAICEHDIAGCHCPVHSIGLREVVRPHWRNRGPQQHPSASMKQRHQMCDRESATRGLRGGLTKGPLQLWRVWHGTAGTVHHPHPVAMPVSCGGDVPVEPIANLLEQALEKFQRQPAASHAIGLRGHVLAQEAGNVAACRVAMEHLEKEPLNRGDRVKLSGSP